MSQRWMPSGTENRSGPSGSFLTLSFKWLFVLLLVCMFSGTGFLTETAQAKDGFSRSHGGVSGSSSFSRSKSHARSSKSRNFNSRKHRSARSFQRDRSYKRNRSYRSVSRSRNRFVRPSSRHANREVGSVARRYGLRNAPSLSSSYFGKRYGPRHDTRGRYYGNRDHVRDFDRRKFDRGWIDRQRYDRQRYDRQRDRFVHDNRRDRRLRDRFDRFGFFERPFLVREGDFNFGTPVTVNSRLPSSVEGIGTFAGSLSAVRDFGNGVYFDDYRGYRDFYRGYRDFYEDELPPSVPGPAVKIISMDDAQAVEAESNCVYEHGICVVRP